MNDILTPEIIINTIEEWRKMTPSEDVPDMVLQNLIDIQSILWEEARAR